MNDICAETGVWLRDTTQGHEFDLQLCESINFYLEECGASSLYDLGCGHGLYTSVLRSKGIDCSGYDGNPFTKQITGGLCEVLDLSKPVDLAPKDFVLCLEVGEHVPRKFEDEVISNIHKSCRRGVILSWAVENQPGEGHVNCRNNDYIEKIFIDLGYTQNHLWQNILREKSNLSWFKNTIMIFEKNDNKI